MSIYAVKQQQQDQQRQFFYQNTFDNCNYNYPNNTTIVKEEEANIDPKLMEERNSEVEQIITEFNDEMKTLILFIKPLNQL